MDLSRNGRDLLQSSVIVCQPLKRISLMKRLYYILTVAIFETSKVPIAEGDDNYSYYAVWKSDEKERQLYMSKIDPVKTQGEIIT